MNYKSIKLSALSIALASALTACGGGGSDSSSGGSTTPVYDGKKVEGVAVDFYLAGATVQFDNCLDNEGKPITVKTNAQGTFEFTTTEDCKESPLTITGGTDTVTEKPFTGTLKVREVNLENGKKIAVTPLTTLQAVLPKEEFKAVLINLGFSNLLANDSGSASESTPENDFDFDASSFNPVEEGTAEQLATVFVVQQLLTQIEDAVETSGGSSKMATEIAAKAIGSVIKEKQIDLNSLSIPNINDNPEVKPNNPLLDSIMNKAAAEIAKEAENDPTLIIDTKGFDDLKESISNSVSNIATSISTVGLTGDASKLVEALNTNTSVLEKIQDAMPIPPVVVPPKPEFTTLKIGNYSLLKFQQTTQSKPLLLTQSQFLDITKVDLKLTGSDTSKTSTAKIGLQVSAGTSPNTKYLHLVLDTVNVNFNLTGTPSSAILPKGSLIKVDSNVNALKSYKNITLEMDKDVVLKVNNGVIDLSNFSVQTTTLQNAFNSYYNDITNVGTAKVETTINLNDEVYKPSESLSIPVVANKTILDTKFVTPYNVVGYFKFTR